MTTVGELEDALGWQEPQSGARCNCDRQERVRKEAMAVEQMSREGKTLPKWDASLVSHSPSCASRPEIAAVRRQVWIAAMSAGGIGLCFGIAIGRNETSNDNDVWHVADVAVAALDERLKDGRL